MSTDMTEPPPLADRAELDGHVALVVGGTRGIGLAICEALCRRGAHVITCGTGAEGVANVAALAAERQWSIEAVQADVRRENDLDALIAHAVKQKGHLSALIFCAGRAWRGDAGETSIEDWDDCLALNLRAPFIAAKFALPHLQKAEGASIVFVSSIWAVTATRRRVAYSVAKAGLTALTRNLAIDYGHCGIRVNAVAPGYIETDLLRRSIAQVAQGRDLLPEIEARHPLRRIGRPGDIGETVAFLVGPGSQFITGQTILIDGGMTAKFALADHWE
jgi:NAD(P)-dependent dehydrogenase (short-subunit alcohol dehydrogenase family)